MPLTTRVFSDEKRLDRDAQLAEHFRQRLLEEIDLETIFKLDNSKRRARLEKVLLRLITAEGPVISSRERASLIRRIIDEAVGLGVLEPLLADGNITEIMVNGINDVFVERRGRLERVPSVFRNEDQLYQVIDRIVSSVNRRIDESSPMVDARLEGGERVNIIIPPLALDGPTVTIRRFPRPFRLPDLVTKKSINKPIMELLKVLVEARLSVLVSGGTGTGKTTFLNALSGAIPESERIITIEDDAELSLQQAHVVRLESRPANIEGEGEVTIRDLVKNALRMRPDRIVVGEVRGAEAMDMLQAMNTGHEGSLTTVHANSAEDALVRLETLASMSELELPVDTLRDQINTALNIIVQLTRSVEGYRHVAEISALLSKHRENYQVSTIAKYVYDTDPIGDEPGHFEYFPLPESYVEAIRVKGLSVPTEFLRRKK
ncbi:ATPase, T2SS/T4P/T4SS family [uncultured Mobiluncus sp.]|uniref:CpaF family protein n=1 Tax=uncultured Mobiluncus sp. TaxID=293425 RepID=UPI0027D9A915|nr:ATPase, T2SS/T4P/T4SS family [uncultured Mobiluncus sp.]